MIMKVLIYFILFSWAEVLRILYKLREHKWKLAIFFCNNVETLSLMNHAQFRLVGEFLFIQAVPN